MFGAFTNLPSQNLAGDLAYSREFGTRFYRHFSSSLPSDIENVAEARGLHAAGFGVFLSVHTSRTNGKEPKDQAGLITSLSKSMRAEDMLANWNEPEAPGKNLTPSQYVSMNRQFYEIVKAANSKVIVPSGSHMEYQMRSPGSRGLPLDAWYVGDDHSDGLALDVYCNTWNKLSNGGPVPLEQLPGFALWWPWASKKNKPIYIAELGCAAVDKSGKQSFTDQQRADWYGNAIDWLTQRGVALISPWNGEGSPGDDQFYYWGGTKAFPLTTAAIAKRVAPVAPVGTPWAAPIMPDPTYRIKTAQSRSGAVSDGVFGEKSLAAWEAVLNERDALESMIAKASADLKR